ncbi:unnamed protein product, partial [Discosporangium mesarthrocarpum]
MRLRRKRILSVLAPDEIAPTVSCFPMMGVGDFWHRTEEEKVEGGAGVRGPIANSAYVPDSVINPHPRFGALTKNIRARRGKNVEICIPLFKDTNTPEFHGGGVARLPLPPGAVPEQELEQEQGQGQGQEQNNGHLNGHGAGGGKGEGESKPYVHMDAMAFGMGCCCLQVTFQARDVDESRFMYDQLAVLSPVMLALTAATPILKGRLVDTDVRWKTIACSVDDRTPAELGLLDKEAVSCPVAGTMRGDDATMVGGGVRPLHKSRYDSISTYLHYCKRRADDPMHVLKTYNDIPCPIDKEAERTLIENKVDPALAYHIAHLFVRDPLVIFEGGVEEVDDEKSTDHFENIQSTNWQTVRWKPPPPREKPEDPRIGWRTEFRSAEVQGTDAENAAFVVFVVLVTRVILAFDLNLYIPLSKVDENMERAHQRGAV